MPKAISTVLKQEKNDIGSVNPWLITLDITLKDSTILYFVRNNENITFQTHEYIAANFEIDAAEEDAKGTIPTVSLRVCDMQQVLEPYLQAQEGATGSKVTIRVINAAYLAEDYADLELSLEVLTTKSKAGWVTFNLGVPSPFRKRFPLYRTRGNFCNWVRGYNASPRWAECGYSGPLTTCRGTLEDCRAHNNSKRFGGQPGLTGGGLKIA